MFTPFFLTEKDLSLETLDSPQFQFSVSCYFEILDLYILAVFWILDNTYVTGLCWSGSQHFCISKFVCSFIISLCCHTYQSVFQTFWILSQTSFFVNILFAFYILLFTVFELALTRGLFDLFYRLQIFWDWVICQSVDYINRQTLRNYSYTYWSLHEYIS